MTTIPDGLPTLARGMHDKEEGEACVMEYCSVITGDRFSDTPDCTYEPIAYGAQALNDMLANSDRHLLVPFIGRLIAARGPITSAEHMDAQEWVRRYSQYGWYDDHTFNHEMRKIVGRAMEAEDYTTWNAETHEPVTRGPILAFKYDPDAGLAYLDKILTEYEELMGIKPEPVSTEALTKAKELISTGRGLI